MYIHIPLMSVEELRREKEKWWVELVRPCYSCEGTGLEPVSSFPCLICNGSGKNIRRLPLTEFIEFLREELEYIKKEENGES